MLDALRAGRVNINLLALLLCAVAALGAAGIAIVAPFLGVIAVGVAGCAGLLALGDRLPVFYLRLLAVILVGYMFFGRGFAYFGARPVYIGELGLLVAVLTIIVVLPRARIGVLHWLLLVYMGWGLFRTLPYLSEYGITALRDAVIWGYAVFAIAISLIVRREHLDWLVLRYRQVIPFFLIWVPIAFMLALAFGGLIPTWPASGEPLLVVKAGDMGVHLAGVAGFVLMGLYVRREGRFRLPDALFWLLWLTGVGMAGALNRGGLLAAALGLAVAFALRPTRQWLSFFAVAAVLFSLLTLINPQVELGTAREVQFSQVVDNVRSIFADTNQTGLEGTKEWRLEWWGEIFSYTFDGQYFWTGKGFGVNLANADGFQVERDESLRSPHNGHLSVLARMGVPGFIVWVVFQLGLSLGLFFAYHRARNRGQQLWAQINGWLLIYWVAFMVNASFDVYLEGPQGGIWFWSLVGLSMAALRIQHREWSEREPEPDPNGGIDAHPVRP